MRQLLIYSLLQIALYAIVDLGVHGNLYDIDEENIMSVIQNRSNELNQSKIVDDATTAIQEYLVVDSLLNGCVKSTTREYIPKVVLKKDIVEPISGKVLYKNGTTIYPLKELPMPFSNYQLFINADNPLHIQLANYYKNSSNIMVAKGDSKNLLSIGVAPQIARERFEIEAFNIKCLPTIVMQKDDRLVIKEYNINDLVRSK